MVEQQDFSGSVSYGCDTCGRLFWRLADCPRVSSYKTGFFPFRHKVSVNQCLSCKKDIETKKNIAKQQKRMAKQQKRTAKQQRKMAKQQRKMAGQQQQFTQSQQQYTPPQQQYAPPHQKKDSWRSVFIPDIFNSDLDQYRPKMKPPERIRNMRQPTQQLHPRFDPQAARNENEEEQKSQMTQAEIDNAAKMSQEKWQNIENLSKTITDSFLTFFGVVILFWIGLFLLMLTISIAVDYM